MKKKPIMISFTDIQLHSSSSNNPQSFAKKLRKSIKNGEPGRCYDIRPEINQGKMVLAMDIPENIHGQDIIFTYPKQDIPIYLGQDSVEKLRSLKKNKII